MTTRRAAAGGCASQSPSLRGSGRFLAFTPGGRRGAGDVSIPFIAGQWSLRGRPPATFVAGGDVSIPFIAGQWSLPDAGALLKRLRHIVSQSPSLRGSGRFRMTMTTIKLAANCLNPLHCGAVVASEWVYFLEIRGIACLNPLHCGAVVASAKARAQARAQRGLNPLHCGAVVASEAAAQLQKRMTKGLNPLHCGAVVASGAARRREDTRRVSIPFIAGQWSLQERAAASCRARSASQSPSLRGSGRFHH